MNIIADILKDPFFHGYIVGAVTAWALTRTAPYTRSIKRLKADIERLKREIER